MMYSSNVPADTWPEVLISPVNSLDSPTLSGWYIQITRSQYLPRMLHCRSKGWWGPRGALHHPDSHPNTIYTLQHDINIPTLFWVGVIQTSVTDLTDAINSYQILAARHKDRLLQSCTWRHIHWLLPLVTAADLGADQSYHLGLV